MRSSKTKAVVPKDKAKSVVCYSEYSHDFIGEINDLPDDVRSAKSLSSFRKKLKTYLFEKAYPS